jgi:hypothetical protein
MARPTPARAEHTSSAQGGAPSAMHTSSGSGSSVASTATRPGVRDLMLAPMLMPKKAPAASAATTSPYQTFRWSPMTSGS